MNSATSTSNISLRTATENDNDYVNSLTRRVMQAYVEATWPDTRSREYYYTLNSFHQATTRMIQYNGHDIGRITVRYADNRISLDDIHITEGFQGRGIGSYLITLLIAQAATMQLPLELILLKTNPVLKLYQSTGFYTHKEDQHRYYMRIDPPREP